MPDFVDGGRQYRRGVILGLSLAELFTILVFLLLLVLGGYAVLQDHALAEKAALVDAQRDELIRQTAAANPIVAALPGDLIVDEAGTSDGVEGPADPGDELVAAEDEPPQVVIERQQRAIDVLTRELAEFQEAIDPEATTDGETATEGELEDQNAQLQDEVAQLEATKDVLVRQNAQQAGEIARLTAEKEDLVRRNVEQASRIAGLIDRHDSAGPGELGQDSPCWFVDARRGNGESYEKPVYIFDIRITDEDIYVKDTVAPTSAYRDQKAELAFNRDALDRPLADGEFVRAFLPLRLAGHGREIRADRRCTFYVAVWDATSATSKQRYKQAHNHVVQAVFNTYQYISEPWPHD